MRPEITVDALWRRVPLPRSAIGEQRLERTDGRPCRAFLQSWHRSSVWYGSPGGRADDSVHREPTSLLELLDRRLELRPENAVDSKTRIWRPPKRSLQSLHRFTGST